MNKDNHLIFEAYKNRLVNEDMPYPTFAKLSKHASPKSSKEKAATQFKDQMPDSKEEYSAHDYAKEMEAKGEGAENITPVSVTGNIEDLGNGYSIHFDEIREPDNRYYSIDVYKNAGNHKYIPVTSFYPSGNDGDKMHGYVSAENPKSKQIVIDLLNKYNLDLPAYGSQQREESEERRIDPKCWKGYHKQGTKVKGGVRVNNCVKN